jgi:hypothetical protein
VTEPGRHLDNGAEASGGSTVDEPSQLGRKPILEWTREDWQLWATGLSNGSGVDQVPADQVPVDQVPADQLPVDPAPVDPGPIDPVDRAPVDRIRAEPEAAQDGAESGASVGAETPTQVSVAPAEIEAEQAPAGVEEAQLEGPGPAVVEDLRAARPWAGPRGGPVQASRTRLRSAVELMVLAVVVGVAVAGLVTFTIVVSGLVLRRALG